MYVTYECRDDLTSEYTVSLQHSTHRTLYTLHTVKTIPIKQNKQKVAQK